MPAFAGVWDIEPDIPRYDPVWQNINNLWNKCERNTDNLDKIIRMSSDLVKKYPDKSEPLLWLAWGNYQRGLRTGKSERPAYLRSAVEIAQKSYAVKKDIIAFKILIASGGGFKDINEIKAKYGGWIKSAAPLPIDRPLPELNQFPEWKAAINNWDKRDDINKAYAAVNAFKKIADKEKNNCSAQLWAAVGMFYLGQFYEYDDKLEKSLLCYKEGGKYAENALKIKPQDVPANYWYFLTFGKSIEHESLYVKIVNSKDLMDNIVTFMFGNPLYFYCGPLTIISDAIVKESFIMGNIMELFGFGSDQLLTSLELAELCYPDYFRIVLCKCRILYNLDREQEARKAIADLLKRDPKADRLHSAENVFVLKEARAFLTEIK